MTASTWLASFYTTQFATVKDVDIIVPAPVDEQKTIAVREALLAMLPACVRDLFATPGTRTDEVAVTAARSIVTNSTHLRIRMPARVSRIKVLRMLDRLAIPCDTHLAAFADAGFLRFACGVPVAPLPPLAKPAAVPTTWFARFRGSKWATILDADLLIPCRVDLAQLQALQSALFALVPLSSRVLFGTTMIHLDDVVITAMHSEGAQDSATLLEIKLPRRLIWNKVLHALDGLQLPCTANSDVRASGKLAHPFDKYAPVAIMHVGRTPPENEPPPKPPSPPPAPKRKKRLGSARHKFPDVWTQHVPGPAELGSGPPPPKKARMSTRLSQ